MLAIIRFSLQDMLRHYKAWLAMSGLIAATMIIHLTLGGYRGALQKELGTLPYQDLIVQESYNVGEIYGSQLSPDTKDRLLAMGISRVIPEIHDVTGTSFTNIILLRGIDLGLYGQVNSFDILRQYGSSIRSTSDL